MEWKTLYEIKLSESKLGDKSVVLVASILQGKGVVKRHDTPESCFFMNRLEFKHATTGEQPITISLSNADFIWLINCMKLKSDKSTHVGKKKLIFNKFGDSTYTLHTNTPSGKWYGIDLYQSDIDTIMEKERVLGFLLKYHNTKGSDLKEITTELFVAVLSTGIQTLINDKCLGCVNGSDQHDVCRVYFRDMVEKYQFLDKALNNILIDVAFTENFNHLMTVLNVSTAERLVQTQLTIPEIRSNRELLSRKVCAVLDLKDGMAYDLKVIMELIKQ